MQNKFRYLALLVFITFMGCEKQIELDLPSVESKLVVDGWFTNELGEKGTQRLQTIRLTQSIPYNTFDYPVVKDAKVMLKDDKGQAFPMIYKVPMVYDINLGKKAANEKKGRYEIKKNLEQNTSYTLFIETADGREYESTPQMVIEYPYTPKISVEYKEEDDFSDENEGYYINFEPEYSEEGNFYFCWQLFRVLTYTDMGSHSYSSSGLLFGSNVYISVKESETQFDWAVFQDEKYFIKQHVIVKRVYDFLRLAKEQRDNEGTQFSPPPSPLRSNIKRIGGSTLDDDALGFFIISSVQKTSIITVLESVKSSN